MYILLTIQRQHLYGACTMNIVFISKDQQMKFMLLNLIKAYRHIPACRIKQTNSDV